MARRRNFVRVMKKPLSFEAQTRRDPYAQGRNLDLSYAAEEAIRLTYSGIRVAEATLYSGLHMSET